MWHGTVVLVVAFLGKAMPAARKSVVNTVLVQRNEPQPLGKLLGFGFYTEEDTVQNCFRSNSPEAKENAANGYGA